MEGDKDKSMKGIALDWKTLLPSHDKEPPEIVVKSTGVTMIELPKPYSLGMDAHNYTDSELNGFIERHEKNFEKFSPRLADKGAKILDTVKQLKEERERRKSRRTEKGADVCDKPTQSTGSNISRGFQSSRQENMLAQAYSCPSPATSLSQKMEDNIDCKAVNAFDEELSLVSRPDRRRKISNGELSPKAKYKGQSMTRDKPFQSLGSLSMNAGSDSKRRGRTYSFRHSGGLFASCSRMMKDDFHVPPSHKLRCREGQTVVLLDEEDQQLIERMQEEKLDESMKEAKIYYPSSSDPESVEICYADTKCLAPQGYLTSAIMNFYIRYLQHQASQTNRMICDYHFFNTFFYNKLREALSYEGNDKYTFFAKLRRWWKGTNIFQKSYVLIPIHEDLHWSLVIICIPDKEDESRPIILHLDSLGLHFSKSVFDSIRSFLREEWNYLNRDVHPPDFPISDSTWKHLPSRILEKKIPVPQQKNDHDCGLFVLFFMERFIEEAPGRLKMKDLAMFGKHWFKPEEASGLRRKIKNLLMEQFQNAMDATRDSESSPSGTKLNAVILDATGDRGSSSSPSYSPKQNGVTLDAESSPSSSSASKQNTVTPSEVVEIEPKSE